MQFAEKIFLVVLVLIKAVTPANAQTSTVSSPDGKINISLHDNSRAAKGTWFLTASYASKGKTSEVIPQIKLGLKRSDQDFSKELKLIRIGKQRLINESYTALHGKKSLCTNTANEVTLYFENPAGSGINAIVRAYNDGLTFRYEFPGKGLSAVVQDELTSYTIPDSAARWMEKWNPANEGLYTAMKKGEVQQQEWGYPALFNTAGGDCWFLIHEAGLDRTYCGTKLSNLASKADYKLSFPDPKDGNRQGEVNPIITLPWKSPWRVVIIGSLANIVESTLIDDVSAPSVLKNTEWIKPGITSWNYWSNNHGTKDYKVVTGFADLAAEMKWPYTLLDWEWDAMGNGGDLEDAIAYIRAKGVKPLIWYNSGGTHTFVPATPKDRMLTHENRAEEFTKLKKMGVAGVKIDFFESEKQDMIRYYLDILEDAAKFQMMVYFHGCLVPRGWARTYPHLMTYEGVRGAEWYNNGPEFTNTAPEHNAILPFTRNVVGAMDYTPVTFTNSQFPHITSYGHELALGVLFESGLQHLADRPEGYRMLPDTIKAFLSRLPNAWDEISYVDGYPGKDIILARRKGRNWYLGGINAEIREKKKLIKLDFLPENKQYELTLIADGVHDKSFSVRSLRVNSVSEIDVKMLRRGGFAASLIPVNE